MRRRSFLRIVPLCLILIAFVPGFAGASSGGRNLAGILAAGASERASAVSGPIINISPASHDFGRLNVGSSGGSFDFTITNTGDADLHVSGAAESNPGKGFSVTIPGTIVPGDTGLLTATWTSTGSGPVTDNFSVQSDATNGSYVILVLGTANNAPEFTPPLLATYVADAFVPFGLNASAVDPEDDAMDWSLASTPPLPVGPSFDHTNGAFTWTPEPGDAGDYSVTITVTDGIGSTAAPFTLRVRAENRPPVANPGGPYTGYTGIPLQIDGTASSDPDAGQTLTYEWDLGDETRATGPLPVHAYGHAGLYVVTLTVADSDVLHLHNSTTTTAEIFDYVEATIVQNPANGNAIRTSGNGVQKFGLQMFLRPVTDVDPSTIRMSTTFPNAGTVPDIKIDDARLKVGDINNDGYGDLDFSFRNTDLRALLAHVPAGQTITLLIKARARSDAIHIRGSVDMVKQGASTLAAVAAPNPFNPETSISYSAGAGGSVSIRIFTVAGRLIRSLVEEPAAPGAHRVHWDGTDDDRRPVPSGTYFVRVEQNGGSSIGKVSVIR